MPPSSDSRATECFTVKPGKPTLDDPGGRGPGRLRTAGDRHGHADQHGPQARYGRPPAARTGRSTRRRSAATRRARSRSRSTRTAHCTVLATGTGTNPQTVTVSGDGTYGPVSFTPDAPGTYHWVATYHGDSPNTLAADRVRVPGRERGRRRAADPDRRSRPSRAGSRTTPRRSRRRSGNLPAAGRSSSGCTTTPHAPGAAKYTETSRSRAAARARR